MPGSTEVTKHLDALGHLGVVGAGVALVVGDEPARTSTYGRVAATSDADVDVNTSFSVGSISKTFTTLAILQLVHDGRVGLDDPVNAHLRRCRLQVPSGAREATIRDILTHTSGVGEFRSLRDLLRRRNWGVAIPADRPLPPLEDYYRPALMARAAPGVVWAYSNHAFALLGQLIEDVARARFDVAMRQLLFEPLGMRHTSFAPSIDRSALAPSYVPDRGTPVRQPLTFPATVAAGGAFSTTVDMARYLQALLNEGKNDFGRIASPELLRNAVDVHWQLDPRLPGQGLGFMLDEAEGHRIVWHDGAWSGYTAALHLAIDDRIGVVVMTNTSIAATHGIAHAILREALGLPAVGAATARASRPPVDAADAVSGVYVTDGSVHHNVRNWLVFGGQLTVSSRDSGPTLKAAGGLLREELALHRVSSGDDLLYQAVADVGGAPQLVRVAFHRNADGRISELRTHAVLPARFVRQRRWMGAHATIRILLWLSAVKARFRRRRRFEAG